MANLVSLLSPTSLLQNYLGAMFPRCPCLGLQLNRKMKEKLVLRCVCVCVCVCVCRGSFTSLCFPPFLQPPGYLNSVSCWSPACVTLSILSCCLLNPWRGTRDSNILVDHWNLGEVSRKATLSSSRGKPSHLGRVFRPGFCWKRDICAFLTGSQKSTEYLIFYRENFKPIVSSSLWPYGL